MAKPEPSMDEWLKEAKQDPKAAQCGMFLTHNGVVRITPKGYEACQQCEDALSDYFTCVMARLEPEQAAQLNALRGALIDAIVAENAARIKPKGEPNHDENL